MINSENASGKLHKDEEILIMFFVEKHNTKTGQNTKVFLDILQAIVYN
jgi:hypothetical protein